MVNALGSADPIDAGARLETNGAAYRGSRARRRTAWRPWKQGDSGTSRIERGGGQKARGRRIQTARRQEAGGRWPWWFPAQRESRGSWGRIEEKKEGRRRRTAREGLAWKVVGRADSLARREGGSGGPLHGCSGEGAPVVRQISKRRQARGERDSGCKRGPAGQRVEEKGGETGLGELVAGADVRLMERRRDRGAGAEAHVRPRTRARGSFLCWFLEAAQGRGMGLREGLGGGTGLKLLLVAGLRKTRWGGGARDRSWLREERERRSSSGWPGGSRGGVGCQLVRREDREGSRGGRLDRVAAAGTKWMDGTGSLVSRVAHYLYR